MENEELKDVVDNSNDVLENNSEEIVQENSEVKIEENKETSNVEQAHKKEIENLNNDEKHLSIPKEKRLGAMKNNKKRKVVVICLAIVLVIVLVISTYICLNKLNENVYNNVYVLGENVSDFSTSQVKNVLSSKNNIVIEGSIEIIQDTETIYTVLKDDINVKVDVASTLNNVMSFGRTGNIFKDTIDIFFANFKKVNIDPVYIYDEEKLDETVKNIDLSIKNRLVESKYAVDEQNKKLVITIGKTGNGINAENEKSKILTEIKKNYTNEKITGKIHLDISTMKNLELNVEEIYNSVKRDPKDAYIDRNSSPIKLVSEVVGLNIDSEELAIILNDVSNKEEGKVIEIPLEIIEPKVKLEDLDKELYSEKIVGYTTYFDPAQHARSNNLRIALEYLNGKVIMPGEVFSYNDAIGDTNAAKGYLPAATFKGGTTVNEMGGGICQTTSTLYNVALMANLQIVERHQHGLPVGYVQPSRDATVYSPYLDFKFKNTRSNPIKIVTSFSSSGSLNISLYGIKEKEEYEVELISQYLGTIPYTTRYIYDENMNEGEQIVVANGVNGYTSQCFISKKLNGVQVSYELLSKDTYNAQQKVVRVGTKKVNNIQGS